MTAAKERTKRYGVRVVCVSISVAKARKILRSAGGGIMGYDGDLRDAYLDGVRDAIGGDIGFAFVNAAKSGDIRKLARFCRDGWRVLGLKDAALFSAKTDSREFLREVRRLCDRYLREGGAE